MTEPALIVGLIIVVGIVVGIGAFVLWDERYAFGNENRRMM